MTRAGCGAGNRAAFSRLLPRLLRGLKLGMTGDLTNHLVVVGLGAAAKSTCAGLQVPPMCTHDPLPRPCLHRVVPFGIMHGLCGLASHGYACLLPDTKADFWVLRVLRGPVPRRAMRTNASSASTGRGLTRSSLRSGPAGLLLPVLVNSYMRPYLAGLRAGGTEVNWTLAPAYGCSTWSAHLARENPARVASGWRAGEGPHIAASCPCSATFAVALYAMAISQTLKP